MLILCPSCDAGYDVPDSLMYPGRRVRCGKCGTEWVAVTDEATEPEVGPDDRMPTAEWRKGGGSAEGAVAAVPFVSTMDRLAASHMPPRASKALSAAWAGSIAILLLALVAGVVWRRDVMQVWPASAHLFWAFGLTESAAATPH